VPALQNLRKFCANSPPFFMRAHLSDHFQPFFSSNLLNFMLTFIYKLDCSVNTFLCKIQPALSDIGLALP
jgi:hypothetical protein